MPQSKPQEPDRRAIDELLRSQEPLPPYELDPSFGSMIQRPVGELISRAMKIRSDEDMES